MIAVIKAVCTAQMAFLFDGFHDGGLQPLSISVMKNP